MATTATNKQPLLVDRLFHNVVAGNTLTSGSATSLDILGTNESSVLVDCSSNDGGIVEDLYTISRTTSTTAYKVLFYLSNSIDYLRPSEALLVAMVTSSTTPGVKASVTDLPTILAPLPHVGSNGQLRALYVPKGQILWCTLQLAGPVSNSDAPIIAAQGGFY